MRKALVSILALVIGAAACVATAEARYGRDLLGCVADADTREESRACRARVDREWEAGAK